MTAPVVVPLVVEMFELADQMMDSSSYPLVDLVVVVVLSLVVL